MTSNNINLPTWDGVPDYFLFNSKMIIDQEDIVKLKIDKSGRSALAAFSNYYFKCKYENGKYIIKRYEAISGKVAFTNIQEGNEKEETLENQELKILRKCNNKIFYTSELGEVIGSGFEGTVYAQKTVNGSIDVCKFDKYTCQTRHENLKRMIAIQNTLSNLPSSKHIAQFKGVIFSEERKRYGLIFEYINGDSLENFIERCSSAQKEAEIFRLFYEMSLGLQQLSDAGIPHRDLLEPNILVRNSDHSTVLIDYETSAKKADRKGESKKEFATLLCKYLFDSGFDRDKIKKQLKDSKYPQEFKIVFNECLNCKSSKNINWLTISNAISAIIT